MMNGGDIKKQISFNQTKKVVNATPNTTNASNGQKRRRKGENLKPIITTDGPVTVEATNPAG
jgi:hypothetical protein